MTTKDRKIRAAALNEFKPATKNSNAHSEHGMQMLAESMRRDGYTMPMLAAADGEMIAGSARLEKAEEVFPDREVIVVESDGQNPIIIRRTDIPNAQTEQAQRIGAMDNRISQVNYTPDAEIIKQMVDAGVLDGPTWGNKDDLAKLLQSLRAAKGEDESVSDLPSHADELQGKWQTVPGQLWAIGTHRIICGDSTSDADVALLMAGTTAQAMWSDPPYGVHYVGKTKDALQIENDGAEGLEGLLAGAWACATTVLDPGCPFYIASPAGPLGITFRTSIVAAGWRFHQSLAWVKDSMVLGHSDYHYRHEDILYGFTAGGEGRRGRGGANWYGNNAQTSVFLIDRPKRSTDHPTMKPVELITAQLANSTKPGDRVYEPFAGSGSTMVAAENLGLSCMAIEIDPRFVAVCLERLTLLGLKAERL